MLCLFCSLQGGQDLFLAKVQPFSDFLLKAICCLASKSQTNSLTFEILRIPLCLILLKLFVLFDPAAAVNAAQILMMVQQICSYT